MGQAHYILNLTRREMLHPHRCGDGYKLMEFAMSGGGTMACLAILLACSNGRGGGDLRDDGSALAKAIVGRWAGDKIAIVGEYSEPGDVVGQDLPSRDDCVDISEHVRAVLVGAGEDLSEPLNDESRSKFVAPNGFVSL